MAIRFVSKGAFTTGNTSTAPPIPAGMQAGDFMVLVVETEGATIAAPSPAWTQVPGSPQSIGGTNVAGGVRLAVYTRFWQSGDAAPTVTTTGANHAVSIIFGFSGVDATTPLDGVAPTTTSAASSATLTMPGITTATNNAVVVHCMAVDLDATNTAGHVGNPTNANLTFTGFGTNGELHDQTINTQSGGGLFVAAGRKAVAGATGNTTATQTASAYLGITLSLRAVPDAADARLTLGRFRVSGTATTNRNASANRTLRPFTVSGTATVVSTVGIEASASLTLNPLTTSGTATVVNSGANASANLTLNPLTLSGTATVVSVAGIEASASLTLAPFSLTASAQNAVRAQAAVTLGALSLTSLAQVPAKTQAALTLSPLTLSGATTVVPVVGITATANLTLGQLRVSGTVTSATVNPNSLDRRKLFRLRRSTPWRERFYRV